jgi:ankyrin repeat protein
MFDSDRSSKVDLLDRHVNYNDVDRSGNAPLHIAVINGRAANVELLLRTAKESQDENENMDGDEVEEQTISARFGLASIHRANKARFCPLHLAALHGHLVKVSFHFISQFAAIALGRIVPNY